MSGEFDFNWIDMAQSLQVQMDEFKKHNADFHIRPHNPTKKGDEIDKHYQKCQMQLEHEYPAYRPIAQYINYKKSTDSSGYKALDNNIKIFRSAANQAVHDIIYDAENNPQADKKWAKDLLGQLDEKYNQTNPALQMYPINRYAANLLVIDFKNDEQAEHASYLLNSRGIESVFMKKITSDTTLAKSDNRAKLSGAIEKGKGFINLPPRIAIDISQTDFQNHLAVKEKIYTLVEAQKAQEHEKQQKQSKTAAQKRAEELDSIKRLKAELFTKIEKTFPQGNGETAEIALILAGIMQETQETAKKLGAANILRTLVDSKNVTSLADYRDKKIQR